MVLFEAKFFIGLSQFNTDILSLHTINIPFPCFATCRSTCSRLWMFTRGRIPKVWLDHDIRNESTCESWDHKVAAIMLCQVYFPNWSNLLQVSVQVCSRQSWWLAEQYTVDRRSTIQPQTIIAARELGVDDDLSFHSLSSNNCLYSIGVSVHDIFVSYKPRRSRTTFMQLNKGISEMLKQGIVNLRME